MLYDNNLVPTVSLKFRERTLVAAGHVVPRFWEPHEK